MPWKDQRVMNQRAEFVFHVTAVGLSVAEACRQAGISRKTGYKWIKRYRQGGVAALEDASSAPHRQPHKTDESVERYVVELRRKYPTWGARKLRALLLLQHPGRHWPAASTIHDMLCRNGLVEKRKRCRTSSPHSAPLAHATGANEVWSIDYKGQFQLRSGAYCYPLTITDNYSRMLLGCFALRGTRHEPAKDCLTRVFNQYGLPRVMRSDNGVPFATTGVRSISRLSAWWCQLGITPERIEPGKPQQNGRHERMHLTLKQETTRPASGTFEDQQKRFDAFQKLFNEVRPHEALGQTPPAQHFRSSPRKMPNELSPIDYPLCDKSKRVRPNGTIRLAYGEVFVGESLRGQYVGLVELDDGVWLVQFAHLNLGCFEPGETRLRQFQRGKIERRIVV